MNPRRALLTLLALGACSDAKPTPPAERTQTKRTIPPPPRGTVQPLPPHAIRTDGFGPYKLGDTVNQLLLMQPDGARMVRFDVPGVVRTGLLRFEDDDLLVGGEPGSIATFLAVVTTDVARTETGVHVGSAISELEGALGPRVDEPYLARDPRLVVMQQLRRVRAVLDGDRITAFVLAPEPATPPPGADECTRPPSTAPAFGACLSPAGEIVTVTGTEVVVRSVDGVRTLGSTRIADLLFAVPLRAVEDRRDDLVVVTRTDDSVDRRTWSVAAYRLEAGKLVRIAETAPAYSLTSAQTRFIGTDIRAVELYLELAAQTDGIEITGVLTTDTAGRVRDVGMISPVLVARGHGGKAPVQPLPGAAAGLAGATPDATGAGSASVGAGRPLKPALDPVILAPPLDAAASGSATLPDAPP